MALSKTCTLEGTVVVQAKPNSGDPFQIVSTGNSDKTGNFSLPYPYGKFSEARASTSLDNTSVTPMKVNPELTNESIADDFLYVLFTSSFYKQREERRLWLYWNYYCRQTPVPGRPYHVRSVHAGYSGTCQNLTIPNRTLREFDFNAVVRSSDPDVANYTLSPIETQDPSTGIRNVTFSQKAQGKVTRRRIDLNNPVKWEDITGSANQTLYEAVTVSTGHVLHYKTEFRADGYSLGNLLYALPLAPGQKKEVVILDTSRSFRGSETQSLTMEERLRNDLVSERDIVDEIGGNIGERLAGSSEATTAGVSASAGASGGGVGYSANVGVAGGVAKSSSEANQNSGREMAGQFSEKLKQGLHQNAASYRQ